MANLWDTVVGNLVVPWMTPQGGMTSLTVGSGTKTATATAGAATLNQPSGVITTESLTTASQANYTLTLTNSQIAAGDIVQVAIGNGTNSAGTPVQTTVTPAAGSVVIVVKNDHASNAFNGTLSVRFLVVKG